MPLLLFLIVEAGFPLWDGPLPPAVGGTLRQTNEKICSETAFRRPIIRNIGASGVRRIWLSGRIRIEHA